MRSALAGGLVVVAVLAALVVQVMAWAGRDLTDADAFADAVVATLRSDAGSRAVASAVTARVERSAARSGVPASPALGAAVGGAVRTAVGGPAFADAVRPVVARSHDAVLDDPSAGVTVRLAALRAPLVAGLDPAAARLVPPAEAFPTIVVPLPLGARPVVETVATLRDAWPLAIVVLLGSLAGALLVATDRPGVLRAAGTGILILAAVPPLVRLAVPPAAEETAPPGTGGIARAFALEVTDGWLVAAAWTAAAGLALVVTAAALRTRRPAPGRRRR